MAPSAILVLTAFALAVTPGSVLAADLGDAVAGRHLADNWCSSCHIVDPAPGTNIDIGAPTFSAIAAMPSTTPLALRVFLLTPHDQMPDLHLTHDQIDDLSDYILSLRAK